MRGPPRWRLLQQPRIGPAHLLPPFGVLNPQITRVWRGLRRVQRACLLLPSRCFHHSLMYRRFLQQRAGISPPISEGATCERRRPAQAGDLGARTRACVPGFEKVRQRGAKLGPALHALVTPPMGRALAGRATTSGQPCRRTRTRGALDLRL